MFKSFCHCLKKRWQVYALIAPFLILFTIMTVLPVASSIVLSFFNYDMVSMPTFAGIGNYFRMFLRDSVFITVLKNTILLAVITGPVGFLLSFVLAWLINEFRPFVRTLLTFMCYTPARIGNGLFIWSILFSS
ncbi:MAG: carbohydrate ABC transporter permease, partial [Acutalibacteraceae bacterium]